MVGNIVKLDKVLGHGPLLRQVQPARPKKLKNQINSDKNWTKSD